jgi:hypothetical protein
MHVQEIQFTSSAAGRFLVSSEKEFEVETEET